MKTETLFASIFLSLLTCLPVALAAPVPGYKVLSESPPPGQSGVVYDKGKNEVRVKYGEKDMKKHMEHTMYNGRKYPQNKEPFTAGKAGDKTNRKRAMGDSKPLKGYARDEKPPNSMVHNGKGQTVRFLPKKESDREMKLLSTATGKARRTGAGVRFQANPGPNYHGRGDRSLSVASARSPSREKPAWNAGPGKRSDSSGPYPKGKHPEPKTTPKEARQPRGRSRTPKPIGGAKDDKRSPSAGPSKDKKGGSRSSSRSSSSSSSGSNRGRSPGPSGDKKSPSRSPSPKGGRSPSPKGGRSPSPKERTPSPKPKTPSPGPSKGKGKQKAVESPKKPAWNAGPGAQRKSERIASKPPPKATTPAPTTKKAGKKK